MPSAAVPPSSPSIADRLTAEYQQEVLAAVAKLPSAGDQDMAIANLVTGKLYCEIDRPSKTTYSIGSDCRAILKFKFEELTKLFQRYMKELLAQGQWGTDGNSITVVFEYPEEDKAKHWVTFYGAALERAIQAFQVQAAEAVTKLHEIAQDAYAKRVALEAEFKDLGIAKE